MTRAPRVVAVGGGHGLSRGLSALRRLGIAPTAVVAAADDGGSSGRLREDLGIIPPGDLRMALLTLARNRALAAVLQHRFTRGELRGHPLGNLLLVALAEAAGGDFVTALDEAARLLDCAGRVLPSTTAAVELCADIAGREVAGQVRVATADGPIRRIWMDPTPPACKEAVIALQDADVVVLGPGSLYTSVLAVLAVPELGEALAATSARVIYVGNVGTQQVVSPDGAAIGETAGMDAAAHVEAVLAHVPGLVIDTVVLHDGPPPPGPSLSLGTAVPISDRVRAVACQDVLLRDADGQPGWAHDLDRLAAALAAVLDG